MKIKLILVGLVALFLLAFLSNPVSAKYLDITESEYSYVGNYYPHYPNGQNYLDHTSPYAYNDYYNGYNDYYYGGNVSPYTGRINYYNSYYPSYNSYRSNYYPRNSVGVYSDGVGVSFSWS